MASRFPEQTSRACFFSEAAAVVCNLQCDVSSSTELDLAFCGRQQRLLLRPMRDMPQVNCHEKSLAIARNFSSAIHIVCLSQQTRHFSTTHHDIFSVSVFFEFLTGVLRGGLVEVVVKLLFEYCGAGGYKNYAGLF